MIDPSDLGFHNNLNNAGVLSFGLKLGIGLLSSHPSLALDKEKEEVMDDGFLLARAHRLLGRTLTSLAHATVFVTPAEEILLHVTDQFGHVSDMVRTAMSLSLLGMKTLEPLRGN